MDDSYHKCTKPTVFRNEFMIAIAYIVNLVYYFYIGGNYEEKIAIVMLSFLFVSLVPVDAQSWRISHTAGSVDALMSGTTHNTRYTAGRINHSGCAGTVAQDAGVGPQSCAFLGTTNTSVTYAKPAPGKKHMHLYEAFAGALPEPHVWTVVNPNWDFSQFNFES